MGNCEIHMGLAVKLSVAAGWRTGAGNICLSRYEQRKECLKSDPPNFTLLSGLSTDIFRTLFNCNMPTIYTAHQFLFYVLKVLISYQEVSKSGKCLLLTFLHLAVIFCMLQD